MKKELRLPASKIQSAEVKNGENEEVKTFCSKRGLIDFAETKIKNPIHKTPLTFSITENDIDIEINDESGLHLSRLLSSFNNQYGFTINRMTAIKHR